MALAFLGFFALPHSGLAKGGGRGSGGKSVYVRGHMREGSWVSSHYRSAPSRSGHSYGGSWSPSYYPAWSGPSVQRISRADRIVIPGGLALEYGSGGGFGIGETNTPAVAAVPIGQPKLLDPAVEQRVKDWQFQQAKEGMAFAQFAVGMRYLEGRGVEKNVGVGLVWLRSAAERGDSEALKFFERNSSLPAETTQD